jgi:hypothetical protein
MFVFAFDRAWRPSKDGNEYEADEMECPPRRKNRSA